MKVEFKFDLADYENGDEVTMKRMLQANAMSCAFEDIHQKVFRPYYKHGYSKDIEDLVALCPKNKDGTSIAYDIIEKLHDIYIEIIKENDLEV